MAFNVTETKLTKVNGLLILTGTAVNTGGSTGGAIAPGANGTNVTGSSGLKNILFANFTNQTAQKAPQVVKSYDATQDGHIVTITTAADDNYDFEIIGLDNGAYTFG